MSKTIKKKPRKKNVGTENEVVDRLSEIKDTLRKKQKTVLIYGITAVSIVVAAAGLMFYRNTQSETSGRMEHEAYKAYYNDSQKKGLPSEEQIRKSLDLFKQAYGKKESPRLLLYIANSYFELGRYDEAITALNDFIKKYPSEKDILPLAYQKIANIQLVKGNKAEALKTLDTLYKSEGDIFKDFALIVSARILESEGKKEDAIAKYKELTDKFKESPFFEEAKSGLGEKKEG